MGAAGGSAAAGGGVSGATAGGGSLVAASRFEFGSATGLGARLSPERIGAKETFAACGCAIRTRDVPNATLRWVRTAAFACFAAGARCADAVPLMCVAGPAATAVVATTTAVAATFTAAALPPLSSACSTPAMPPKSEPRRSRLFHVSASCSKPAASARRARKIRVSTADCERPSSTEISRYVRPCHSRRRIARRWFSGISSSTSGRRITTWDDFLQDLEVVRGLDLPTAPGGAPPGEADVVRDLEEPGGLELGNDPAREPAEGVHEGRLDGVLGLLSRAQLVHAVAEDLIRVALVEDTRGLCARGGGPFDTGRSTDGRNCGQPVLLDCGSERHCEERSTANVGSPPAGENPPSRGLRSGRGPGLPAPGAARRRVPPGRAAG